MNESRRRVGGGAGWYISHVRPLVWFRSDLRVRDNTALAEACAAASGGVAGVFCVCPAQWREHDWADVRVEFLLRSLSALSERLARINVPLRVLAFDRFDEAPARLLALARECGCGAVYLNDEYEVNERRRDDAVARAFEAAGLAARSCTDQVALAPGSVRTKQGAWHRVFTPFRRAWLERLRQEGAPGVRRAPGKQRPIDVKPDPIPARVEGFDLSRGRPDLWKEGEEHAARRLARFIEDRVEQYAQDRDLPALNGTSTLSPYLTSGVLSARQCLAAAVGANGGRIPAPTDQPSGAATWISELIWREFYKHLIVGFPRLCMGRAFRPETERIRWRDDAPGFEAWRDGRTGFPIVDAAMRQLAQTGWMHNRLRMIVAMFLTKDLLIDWRRGERHFMRSLVDGDLAQNNGGWQWAASTGTDAAPYFRVFNPASQSRKFDPEGRFIRRFVPELAGLGDEAIHDPSALPALFRATLGYPDPIVEHASARRRVLEMFERLKG